MRKDAEREKGQGERKENERGEGCCQGELWCQRMLKKRVKGEGEEKRERGERCVCRRMLQEREKGQL